MLVLDCEHLERKDCILFIPCTQQIKSVFKESWVSEENLGDRVWAEGIIRRLCFLSLQQSSQSEVSEPAASASFGNSLECTLLQAWPQTYWIRTSVLVRALQRSRGNRLFMAFKEICYTGSRHYRDPQVPRSAEQVSKLETQESWWWSSCPKIGRLKTQEEPMFPFKSKDRECWCFSSQAVREEGISTCVLTSLPGGSEALWNSKSRIETFQIAGFSSVR